MPTFAVWLFRIKGSTSGVQSSIEESVYEAIVVEELKVMDDPAIRFEIPVDAVNSRSPEEITICDLLIGSSEQKGPVAKSPCVM